MNPAMDVGVEGTKDHDYAYFSFVVYTSLGFGDIIAVGPMRYVVAVETLTGLVLIGWTASFMYLEMQKYWHSQ